MSTSKMALIVTCWALLLLTMFPVHAIVGRHVPAPSSTQTIDVPASATGDNNVDSQFQRMQREPAGKDVKSWREINTVVTTTRRNDHIRGSTSRKLSEDSSIYGRRLLVGSSPPTCQGKCGSCNPCNPIHVSIGSPHGALTQQEYYPEVWRCKCGNKLFMP